MNLKISHKIIGLAVSAAFLTGVLIIGMSTYETSEAMLKQSEKKLEAVTAARKEALAGYLSSIEEDINILSSNSTVISSLADFKSAWDDLFFDQEKTLKRLYIAENPNELGQKDKLDFAKDGSSYSYTHSKYHPWLRSFLQRRGYYDIFLIDDKGNVVYSVFKESDFAANVKSKELRDTDLFVIYQKTLNNPNKVSFVDFRPYSPSAGAPAAFIGKAITDMNGKFLGSLVFQMPIERINSIMKNSVGMGESGETYIIGSDFYMRSDSRFSQESTMLKTKVETETVKAALAGGDGVSHIKDYRGVPVFSAYLPMEYLGTKLAIIGEMDEAEVMSPLYSLIKTQILLSAIVLILIIAAAIFVARGITVPFNLLLKKIDLLQNGNADFDVEYKERSDELGDLARALEMFRENYKQNIKLVEEQKNVELEAAEDRKRTRLELADNFESSVKNVVDMVASAATEMEATSKSVSGIVESNKSKLQTLSSKIEGTSSNIQTVSSATSELSSAINEISSQIAKATSVTTNTVDDAKKADSTAQGLSEASIKIGDVVAIINSIASQINLLALNATIEAARAGDAGKGFAVVASEVKSLAGQTTKATEEISEYISAIQDSASQTVNAIKNIGEKIYDINTIASAVAAAVEEQGVATKEITRNLQQAADNSDDVHKNSELVSQSSNETGVAAVQMTAASSELSKQAEILRGEVNKFLDNVRAG
ncbi:MAG: methyl-accepting chemotaxis protein [Rickettsiales bacterium]